MKPAKKTRSQVFASIALSALSAMPSLAAAQSGEATPHGLERANAPVSIFAEMSQRPPDVVLGTTRIWHLSWSSVQRTAIIEMRDGLAPHSHPDGIHYLYVVEGEMTARIADKSYGISRGDYLAIPINVVHQYIVAPGKRIVLLSMDSPPYDPKKTAWLQPEDPPKQ